MAFVIREATIADVHALATVHVLSWQSAYRNIIPDDYLNQLDIEKQAERFKNGIEKYKNITFFYVAENDGQIIGNMAISKCRDDDKPLSGEVIAIYLLPDYWSMGFGKQLMDFGVKILYELGYSEICIWVLEDNLRARKFYEKYGFSLDGTSKEINLGKPLIEVRYTLTSSI